jgi:hypothetical protein
VNAFVYAMALDKNDTTKHDRLIVLKLMTSEWECIELFLGLLVVCVFLFSFLLSFNINVIQHADNAQQAFLSDQVSMLHLGIPALKALHKAWSSQVERPKYAPFSPALAKACEKVDEYYEKTMDSPAYILAMCMLLICSVVFLLNLSF